MAHAGPEFMRDLETRYQIASGLQDRAWYKIFYCQIRCSDVLLLGINPGGDPTSILPGGVGTGASEGFYENGEHDLLDCEWPENRVLKLLVPLLGGVREEVRRRVVKTNMAFRRSRSVTRLDLESAKREAMPFLQEITEAVRPSLVLLSGVSLEDFASRYCDSVCPIGEPVRDPAVRQTVFAAAKLVLLRSSREILGVQVAHASQFSWTYERYDVVGRIWRCGWSKD